MIRTYFNQAFHLIRQNPLFSGFYILGTGLAISMVMLLVVIYYIKVAGIYPETNRARMMVISDVHMQSVDNSNSNSTGLIAYNIVKDLFYNLKGTEAVSAIGTYVAGDGYAQLPSSKHRIPVVQKAVDVAFWKVFDFDFVDGAPFSESDFASGIHHIVISEEVAQRIFNTSKVVGKYLTIDFVEYKICGVVKTPSYATELSYAQVLIPYTCFPGYDKYNQYDALGAYEVVILARSSSDFDSIKAQVDEFTRKFNAISHDGYKLLWHGQPYAYWKTLFRVDSMTDLDFMKIFPSDRSCFADAVVSAGIEFIGHDIGTNGKTFARDRSEKSIWSNVLCLIFTNNLGEPDFDCYWRLSGFDYILWNGVII